ncbi:ATP-binding protein [Streptomyces sp. enrichment culture]|uniref:ATP-binding protein n=1 Tax=Streptomyces sp. enrichment culture TaxID=1795815 RepID=UPI003F5643DC
MNHNPPHLPACAGDLSMKLHPSRAGARLGRELAAVWLRDQGVVRELADDALQLVAELAANAALHGRVPGRSFLLTVRLADAGRVLRVEVTDTRADAVPTSTPQAPPPDSESGRGLLIVAGLADRWGVAEGPVPRKTVWAELDVVRDAAAPLREPDPVG